MAIDVTFTLLIGQVLKALEKVYVNCEPKNACWNSAAVLPTCKPSSIRHNLLDSDDSYHDCITFPSLIGHLSGYGVYYIGLY